MNSKRPFHYEYLLFVAKSFANIIFFYNEAKVFVTFFAQLHMSESW